MDSLPVYDPVTNYEKLHRVGEGTYGVVYKARDTTTGTIVALKKVRFERSEAEGVPTTTVREIKILQKCLDHPNIVQLHKVVTGSRPDSLFMVFEFCDYDLAQLLDHSSRRTPWAQEDVKSLMKQLLSALAFLHDHWIIHRDIKLSNLLVTREGRLKLCDFGLARHYHPQDQVLTPRVVTLWYRAPELLLGAETYTEAVDCWAAGCILAELLRGEPLFPAENEMECIQMQCQMLGTPNSKIWPDFPHLPSTPTIRWPPQPTHHLPKHFPQLSPQGLHLLQGLLTYDPDQRLTARQALEHPYFKERPYPKHPHDLSIFPPTAHGNQSQHQDHHYHHHHHHRQGLSHQEEQEQHYSRTNHHHPVTGLPVSLSSASVDLTSYGLGSHHHHRHHHQHHTTGLMMAQQGSRGLDRRFANAFGQDVRGIAELEERAAKRRRE